MKKLFFLFPALLSVTMLLCACGESKSYDLKACALTTFTAEDFDGNVISEAVFEDSKVTMINVWATYCEPCKEEIPALSELCSEYEEGDFRIIGIPLDLNQSSTVDARKLIADFGATYTNIKISNSVKPLVNNIASVPYTIFINSEGLQIGGAYVGAKSKKDWKTVIDNILEFVNTQQ